MSAVGRKAWRHAWAVVRLTGYRRAGLVASYEELKRRAELTGCERHAFVLAMRIDFDRRQSDPLSLPLHVRRRMLRWSPTPRLAA